MFLIEMTELRPPSSTPPMDSMLCFLLWFLFLGVCPKFIQQHGHYPVLLAEVWGKSGDFWHALSGAFLIKSFMFGAVCAKARPLQSIKPR